MNIFGGRPGIAAGILAVIAILVAFYWTLPVNILIIAVLLLLVALCIVLLAFGIVKPYRAFSIIVVFAVFMTAWIQGVKVFYRTAPEAEALCAEDAYVHATVAERYGSGDYYTVYIVRIISVNGISYDGKAILNCEYNSDLQVGYEFVLRSANVEYTLRLTENEAASFMADGIFLYITSYSEVDCHILSEDNYTLSDRLDKVNSYLCAKLKNTVRSDEGRLSAAMLLGDRDPLTSEMYRDFSRAGISHYLAVSGLHVSIITGLISLFLINLRIKRGLRNTLLILFSLGYLLILGFPVSAVRSVTMLTVVFLAYSMGDNSDTLNSLGIAAAMIVLISPTTVFDKSFILSFCATLGIAAFLPTFTLLPQKFRKEDEKEEKNKKSGKLLWSLPAVIMTTLCAVSATLLPSVYMFEETARYALISNLILAPIGAPMLASSLLCLIFGKVPYIGEGLVYAVRVFSRIILEVAERFSDISGASVSLTSRGARLAAIIFTVILAAALIIKIKRKELLLVIPAFYPIVLIVITLIATAALPQNAQLTCISTGNDENIFVQLREENVLIDVSDGSYTRLRTIADRAQKNGVTEFDTVILTHYHNRHVSAISRFTAEEKVGLVLFPYPTTEDEAWIMVQIADILQKSGVAVRVIPPEGEIEIADGIMLTYPNITRIERSTHPVTYLSFSDGKKRLTYLSASSWDNGLYFEKQLDELVAGSNAVIIGAHGPVNKELFDIPLDSTEQIYIFAEEYKFIVSPEATVPIDRATVNAKIAEFDFGGEK